MSLLNTGKKSKSMSTRSSSSSDEDISGYITKKDIDDINTKIDDTPAEIPLDKMSEQQLRELLKALDTSDISLEQKTNILKGVIPDNFNDKVPTDSNYMPMPKREFLKYKLSQKQHKAKFDRKNKKIREQNMQNYEDSQLKKKEEKLNSTDADHTTCEHDCSHETHTSTEKDEVVPMTRSKKRKMRRNRNNKANKNEDQVEQEVEQKVTKDQLTNIVLDENSSNEHPNEHSSSA